MCLGGKENPCLDQKLAKFLNKCITSAFESFVFQKINISQNHLLYFFFRLSINEFLAISVLSLSLSFFLLFFFFGSSFMLQSLLFFVWLFSSKRIGVDVSKEIFFRDFFLTGEVTGSSSAFLLDSFTGDELGCKKRKKTMQLFHWQPTDFEILFSMMRFYL